MLRTMNENGKEYAIIPMEDYHNLLARCHDEDAADELAYQIAKSKGEEAFPMRLYDAIDAGENPIRVFRTYRGITQAKLAEAAGVTTSYLSHLEKGNKNGSVDVIKKISEALQCDMDDLV